VLYGCASRVSTVKAHCRPIYARSARAAHDIGDPIQRPAKAVSGSTNTYSTLPMPDW
jgi:hypothetical protein